MLLTLTTFAFSLVRRARRDQIDALQERARRLEAERDQQAVSAAAEERARIAREMHDIVAHSLSVIIAQADGGRYAGQAEPAAAVRSLTTIAETGRAALVDMRRLLGVLRTDEPDEPDDVPTGRLPALRPQPAVDEVADLVDQVRASGLEVSMVRMGTPRTLPPGTGVAVYRICQESLTNVLKHAGPAAHATVLLQWGARSLILEVNDDGRGAAAADDGAGQGAVGMRERAAMLGGTLTLGPRPGGGFRVRTEIPIPPAPGPHVDPLPVPPAPALEDL
jgi:signal transduction histidine kinase